MRSPARKFLKLEEWFRSVKSSALDGLLTATSAARVVTLAGDQLTGKSTLAKALVSRLETVGVPVQTVGSGEIFRDTATAHNTTVAELSSWPREKLDRLDVEVEFSTCQRIAVSGVERLCVELCPTSSSAPSAVKSLAVCSCRCNTSQPLFFHHFRSQTGLDQRPPAPINSMAYNHRPMTAS